MARAAEDLLASLPDAEAKVPHLVALMRAVSWLVQAGHYDRARTMQRALDPMIAGLRDEPMAQAAAAGARVYLVQKDDDPEARRALLAVAIARFEETGDRRQACLQRTNLAAVCNLLGAYAEAEALSRAAQAEAEQLGVAFAVRAAQSNLGPALSRRGEHDEARRVLQSALDGATASGDHFSSGVLHLYLAEALLRADDIPAATSEARAALSVLAAFRPYQCLAMAQLAAVLLEQDRAAEALEHARAAFELLEALGEIDEGEALVRVVYAEALYASGDLDGACAALCAARDHLMAEAARLRDGGQRRRFLEDIPEHARILTLVEQWLTVPGG